MNPNYLDFEQPIADLEAKIEELRMVGNDTDINITDEITRLKKKSVSLTESIFSDLKPWDVARLARHPRRPYTLDYIESMFEDFDELHGDTSSHEKNHFCLADELMNFDIYVQYIIAT